MMKTVPKIQSGVGVFVAVTRLTNWLEENPKDSEAREIANSAIEDGWKDLQRNRKLYVASDELNLALENVPAYVFFETAIGETRSGHTLFDERFKTIADAERSLNNPVLEHKIAMRKFQK